MENQNNKINVFDIAKYLYYNCPLKSGTGITQLQKLLYYAQAKHLVLFSQQPLFEEEIQAWLLGPVVPKVYFEFIKYHSENKDVFKFKCSNSFLPPRVKEILDSILSKHGTKHARELIDQVHKEDPWKNIFHHNKKWSNSVISLTSIYDYFKDKLDFL